MRILEIPDEVKLTSESLVVQIRVLVDNCVEVYYLPIDIFNSRQEYIDDIENITIQIKKLKDIDETKSSLSIGRKAHLSAQLADELRIDLWKDNFTKGIKSITSYEENDISVNY